MAPRYCDCCISSRLEMTAPVLIRKLYEGTILSLNTRAATATSLYLSYGVSRSGIECHGPKSSIPTSYSGVPSSTHKLAILRFFAAFLRHSRKMLGYLKLSHDHFFPHPLLFINHYIVTNPVQLNPSWEANSRLATQGFPNIIWKPKFITVFTSATDPYPQPDKFSPYHPILLPYDQF
jgi:hypothetical protein